MSDLLKLPGKVIARGSNTTPTGKLKLKSYRVEEVTLSQPAEIEIRGRREQVTRAFRITVIGGPFPVRAMPPVIWVGDEAVGYGVESEDLDEITAVTFDRSLLREGSPLYLSYGDKENKEDRAELSVKLKLEETNGEAFGQAGAPRACPFNIVGTWKAELVPGKPTLFRFEPHGTVTLLSPSKANPGADFTTLGILGYKLDKPAAPTRLDIIGGSGPSFGIAEYGDDSFTTIHPVDGRRTPWVRAKTNRYFLTFAARAGSQQVGGPAFAMWTKLDGRKTEVETLGLHLVEYSAGRIGPAVGPIPAEIHKQFMTESGKGSDVMFRLELTEAEYARTHEVFWTWVKPGSERTLLYDEPYLNAMEFLRRVAESLNLCGEKVKLHKLTGSQWDEVVTKHHLSQHPLEYIRIMRNMNEELHVTDKKFPADWRPTP